MSKLELVRVDFRMIHGQVMVKWIKNVGASKIVAVNDAIAEDPFLGDIYRMSAPIGIDIETLTRDDSLKECSQYSGSGEKVLVLFKSVEDVYYCFKNGFPLTQVQIGGLGSGPDRVNVFGAVTLNAADAKMLKEMQEADIEVTFQTVPDESKASLDKVLKKTSFGL